MFWASATQTILLVVFGLSTLHAAYKAVNQAREQRRLRERELRWRQSEQARAILNDMEADPSASAAMLCLDWDGRPIPIGSREVAVTHDETDRALRIKDERFTPKEMVIRDLYDHLFFHCERMAQWIEVDLISVYDVIFPIAYLAKCMKKREAVFRLYLDHYDYPKTVRLLQRFWTGELDKNSAPPPAPNLTRWQRLRAFLLDIDPLKAPDVDKMFGGKPAP